MPDTSTAMSIGDWLGGLGGLSAAAWAAWQLFRGLTSDGRETIRSRLDGHDKEVEALEAKLNQLTSRVESRATESASRTDHNALAQRVGSIELARATERGADLPGRLESLDRRMQALEGTVRTEVRTAREQIAEVLDGINELRGSDG